MSGMLLMDFASKYDTELHRVLQDVSLANFVSTTEKNRRRGVGGWIYYHVSYGEYTVVGHCQSLMCCGGRSTVRGDVVPFPLSAVHAGMTLSNE